MIEGIIVLLVGAGIVAVLKYLYKNYYNYRRKSELVTWLRLNTKDLPGESHKNISEAVCDLNVSLDVINRIVSNSNEIFRSQSNPSLISIWRQEPESVYEKRGITYI